MIGVKHHLKCLRNELVAAGAHDFLTEQFSQGKTMRWGIAWSFDKNINLIPDIPDLLGDFPGFPTLLNFETYILSFLTEFHHKYVPKGGGHVREMLAYKNSWSHQRRKRREKKKIDTRLQQHSVTEEIGPPSKVLRITSNEDDLDNKALMTLNTSKSLLTEETKSTFTHVENDSSNSDTADTVVKLSKEDLEDSGPLLVSFIIETVQENTYCQVKMTFRRGTMGKDGINQIMQYLKNSYLQDREDPSSQLYQLLNPQ